MKLYNYGTSVLVALMTICLISLSGQNGFAADSYTTSTGAVFTHINGPENFGSAWRDPSGTLWSSNQGHAMNLERANGFPQISADALCKKIDGKVPTLEDYLRLKTYFETNDKGLFTSRGQQDFYAIFPDSYNETFWSRTMVPPPIAEILYAAFFSNGSTNYLYANADLSVRCAVSGL